jgi:hypothetical protein
VPDPPGLDPVAVDVDVKRAIWIEGRVTDKVTEKPVACHVSYFALGDNPNVRDHPGYEGAHPNVNGSTWKEDGTFRVVGLPGGGVLTVWAGDQYLLAEERDDNGRARGPLNTVPVHAASSSNAVVRVEPPQGVEPFRCELTVDPGVTLTGTLVGPDGKPVVGALSYGLTSTGGWERPPLTTAEFALRGFNPRRPRPVLFRHPDKGLVGVFEPPQNADKPVTVRLQPGATVTGRLVDADDRPRATEELDVIMLDPSSPPTGALGPRIAAAMGGPSSIVYSLPTKIKTDGDGRFRIETLLPGYQYELNDRPGEFARGRFLFGEGLRSGETKDLGTVQMKQPGE